MSADSLRSIGGGSSTDVALVAMGGTIDKEYVIETAKLEVGCPFAQWIEPDLRLGFPLEITQLADKDSVELADSDRRRLLDHLARRTESRILVTHGTDTILRTAAQIWSGQQDGVISPAKTIVFTGAFVPGRFPRSDAPFNLGFALAVAGTAPPDVYIAVGGRFAPVPLVRHTHGHFEYG